MDTLWAAAREADPDPLRNRLRPLIQNRLEIDPDEWVAVAQSIDVVKLTPAWRVLLADSLRRASGWQVILPFARRVSWSTPTTPGPTNGSLTRCGIPINKKKPSATRRSPLPYNNMIQLQLKLGQALYESGDLEGSIAAYPDALSNPNAMTKMHAEIHFLLDQCLRDVGDLDEAIEEIRWAIELDRWNESYRQALDELLDETTEPQSALEDVPAAP